MTVFCDNDKCEYNFQYLMVNAKGCNRSGTDIENGKCISFKKKEIKKKKVIKRHE